jgi:monoamine oxidase
LIEALVRAAAPRVLLQHRVTAIAQAADRVMVTAIDDRGMQQQIEADAAIVALPASTLRDVTIAPALPEPQSRAIRSLRYGRATKVVMETTRDPFRGRARAFATDTPLGAFWDGGGRYVLTFLAGGSASAALRARAQSGAAAVLSDLCWLGMTAAPVGVMHAATWEDDPFARGGYAYFDPAFDPAVRPLLARQAGRLAFAGEHTSERWQGFMNGAVESGLRAAREITSS